MADPVPADQPRCHVKNLLHRLMDSSGKHVVRRNRPVLERTDCIFDVSEWPAIPLSANTGYRHRTGPSLLINAAWDWLILGKP